MNDDLSQDLNTEERNRALDLEILRGGEEIANIELRPLSAGDLALLIEAGVGIVLGKTDSIAFDVGAILYSQSRPRTEMRRLCTNPASFRSAVYDFLDKYEPAVFQEATPKIMELVDRMNSARTSIKGEAEATGDHDPKAGGRAG